MNEYRDQNAAWAEITSVGRRAYEKGYIIAGEGNFSVRLDDERVLTTPSGVNKGFLDADMLVVADLTGRRIVGHLNPSSEFPMHLEIYKNRPDVRAVCHTHAPYALAFAVNRIPLDEALMPEIVTTIGAVPVVPYATPSTQEVPNTLRSFLDKGDAFLLANHGVVTMGATIFEAFDKMENVEHLAKVTYLAKTLGRPQLLTEKDLEKLEPVRQKFNPQSYYTPLKSRK